MERKFKQQWSTILQISAKQTITSRYNSLNLKIKHDIYITLEIRARVAQ
jgi:hypothetical protein